MGGFCTLPFGPGPPRASLTSRITRQETAPSSTSSDPSPWATPSVTGEFSGSYESSAVSLIGELKPIVPGFLKTFYRGTELRGEGLQELIPSVKPFVPPVNAKTPITASSSSVPSQSSELNWLEISLN